MNPIFAIAGTSLFGMVGKMPIRPVRSGYERRYWPCRVHWVRWQRMQCADGVGAFVGLWHVACEWRSGRNFMRVNRPGVLVSGVFAVPGAPERGFRMTADGGDKHAESRTSIEQRNPFSFAFAVASHGRGITALYRTRTGLARYRRGAGRCADGTRGISSRRLAGLGCVTIRLPADHGDVAF